MKKLHTNKIYPSDKMCVKMYMVDDIPWMRKYFRGSFGNDALGVIMKSVPIGTRIHFCIPMTVLNFIKIEQKTKKYVQRII